MAESVTNNSSSGTIDRLRSRISEIEVEVAAGRYRPGKWQRLINDIERLAQTERAALSEDLSRASRLLHRRHVGRVISIRTAIAIELGLAVLGAVLIAFGGMADSNLLAAIGAFAWIVAFQPVIKYAAGRVLGIGYDYAYLYGIEPRLKMKYGSYLAAPRWARALLHLAGTLGSPVGAMLGWMATPPQLTVARHFCIVAFWAVTALNLGLLIAALVGIRKIFGFSTTLSSGGAAARELRAAIRVGNFS